MDLSALVAIGLLLVRIGALVMVAPVFGGTYAPPTLKIGLSLLIAVTLLPVVPFPGALSLSVLAAVVAREVCIGVALGLAVRIVTGAAELGGHLAGFQLGLGYAATIDPASGVRSNAVTIAYSNLALLLFLGINGHHAMLRALAASYSRLPVGLGGVDGSLAGVITSTLGTIFLVGVQLAMPVIVVMLLIELALGLLERAAVGVDIWVLAPPTRVLLGLTALAAGIAAVPEAVSRLLGRAVELAMSLALGVR
ncbi:MAG: flagellar biosynthetic protein FliR [Acidobacteriota bacterium]